MKLTNLRGFAFIPALKEGDFSLCLRAPKVKENKITYHQKVKFLTGTECIDEGITPEHQIREFPIKYES